MWNCAKSTYLSAYERAMDMLNVMSPGAHAYMKKIYPHHWSKAYFQTKFKCDILLNNLCECFNSLLLEARVKGIVTMNEMIRTKLMIRIQKRRDAMKKCTTTHCPKILKKLEKNKQLSWSYNSIWSGGEQYQVVGPQGQFVVNKEEGTCTCRKWQLAGIPCSHAISVIFHNNEKPENFLDDCYKVDTFLETYRHTLNPTQDRDSWPKSEQGPMIPPEPMTKKRGRQTLNRRKEVGEQDAGFRNGRVKKTGVTMKCGICGTPGHNRRHHQGQQGEERTTMQQQQQASSREAGQHNPMDDIDPHILQEHFQMVDALSGPTQSATTPQINPGGQTQSQVNNAPHQPNQATQTVPQSGRRAHKLPAWGGKSFVAGTSHHGMEARSGPNIAKAQEKDKGSRRKKAWVPAGTSSGH